MWIRAWKWICHSLARRIDFKFCVLPTKNFSTVLHCIQSDWNNSSVLRKKICCLSSEIKMCIVWLDWSNLEIELIPYTQTHLPWEAGMKPMLQPVFIPHTNTQTESETEDKQTGKLSKLKQTRKRSTEMTMKHRQLHFAFADDDDHFDCVQLKQHRK